MSFDLCDSGFNSLMCLRWLEVCSIKTPSGRFRHKVAISPSQFLHNDSFIVQGAIVSSVETDLRFFVEFFSFLTFIKRLEIPIFGVGFSLEIHVNFSRLSLFFSTLNWDSSILKISYFLCAKCQ